MSRAVPRKVIEMCLAVIQLGQPEGHAQSHARRHKGMTYASREGKRCK